MATSVRSQSMDKYWEGMEIEAGRKELITAKHVGTPFRAHNNREQDVIKNAHIYSLIHSASTPLLQT